MNEQLAALVRRHDPDRFLTALFAPPDRRDDSVGAVRLQSRTGPRARSCVRAAAGADPPAMVARGGRGRPPPSRNRRAARRRAGSRHAAGQRPAAGDRGAGDGSGAGDRLAGGVASLCVDRRRRPGGQRPRGCWVSRHPEEFRPLGAAYGVAGVLRSVPALAAHQRCLLPADLLAEQGLSPEAAVAEPEAAPVRNVLQRLASEGRALLAAGPRRVRGSAVAAGLPAVLARRDLGRPPLPSGPRGLGDRLAVMAAGLTGRI